MESTRGHNVSPRPAATAAVANRTRNNAVRNNARTRRVNRNNNARSTTATIGKRYTKSEYVPTNTAKMFALRHDLWKALDKITNKEDMAEIYLRLLSRPRDPAEMTLIKIRHAIKFKLDDSYFGVKYVNKSELEAAKRLILRISNKANAIPKTPAWGYRTFSNPKHKENYDALISSGVNVGPGIEGRAPPYSTDPTIAHVLHEGRWIRVPYAKYMEWQRGL